ncbi:MAG TPA: glycoside hydrolase domain-containing protein, partial [Candidatus Glassbacteria bacterium]|nr:glycoside hydrolase domain-containing protein [Candidatus Glassbacteria bacterium]
ETTIRTAFTFSDEHLAQLYGGRLPDGLLRRYHQLIADYRLNVDNIYRDSPPDLETVEYFARKGQLNAFNLKYIGGRIERAGDFDNEAYLKSLADQLDPYVEQLRRRGLAHLAYLYGFDEVGGEMFPIVKRTFGFLKKRYPEIPTMTTGYDASYGTDSGLEDEVDIWVPLTPLYDLQRAEATRRRGKEVWWYICISPPHPYANWFIEYPGIEARLLWWMAYQQKAPGFLYYFINLRQNQSELMHLTGHNRTDWNPASWQTANGDGCFIYSSAEGPVSTIRFENIRDGIEDSELLFLLEKRLSDGGDKSRALCGELINSLTDYSIDTEKFAAVRTRLLAELEKTCGK